MERMKWNMDDLVNRNIEPKVIEIVEGKKGFTHDNENIYLTLEKGMYEKAKATFLIQLVSYANDIRNQTGNFYFGKVSTGVWRGYQNFIKEITEG